MKANTLVPLLGLSSSAAAAAVAASSNTPFGYASGSKESIANLKDKIENVVWILLENRSFDNILGGVKRKGLDNVVNNGPFCNPQNVSDPSSTKWCSVYKDFDSVKHDPDHSVTGYNMELYGTYTPSNDAIANGTLKPTMNGFVEQQLVHHKGLDPKVADEEVMGYYSEDEIPTLVNLVDEFTTFNYWHSCVPGVSHEPYYEYKRLMRIAHQPQPAVRPLGYLRWPRNQRQQLRCLWRRHLQHLPGCHREGHHLEELRRHQRRLPFGRSLLQLDRPKRQA